MTYFNFKWIKFPMQVSAGILIGIMIFVNTAMADMINGTPVKLLERVILTEEAIRNAAHKIFPGSNFKGNKAIPLLMRESSISLTIDNDSKYPYVGIDRILLGQLLNGYSVTIHDKIGGRTIYFHVKGDVVSIYLQK